MKLLLILLLIFSPIYSKDKYKDSDDLGQLLLLLLMQHGGSGFNTSVDISTGHGNHGGGHGNHGGQSEISPYITITEDYYQQAKTYQTKSLSHGPLRVIANSVIRNGYKPRSANICFTLRGVSSLRHKSPSLFIGGKQIKPETYSYIDYPDIQKVTLTFTLEQFREIAFTRETISGGVGFISFDVPYKYREGWRVLSKMLDRLRTEAESGYVGWQYSH